MEYDFDEIVKQYSGILYNHIRKMIGNDEDSKDILQEVFINVYRKIDGFREESSLKTWLFRIASNKTIDFLRREKRFKADELPENLKESSNPLKHTEKSLKKELINRALLKLKEEEREIVIMKELDGFTFREIAEIKGIPENTVKTKLYSSLKKLRKIILEIQGG
ncbi:RNA polymerase sigma-70 factor, ECF subfamily [Thermotomaculum hydrothermale]|uniref:RNA polymerase sigma-70 factor, ECF subfamily n=1 Tax=Thermotomaculum hydrothermale TaxID=981385 RepID=A0A7R6SZW7_9BACT|nr:RNA polymerase sigma factor [Thermotomaculum hydrothermale]BBB33152.1 RNA polymerase sigma-70 factor, ECF subfamily [Thermotomaculum hydrothermale]